MVTRIIYNLKKIKTMGALKQFYDAILSTEEFDNMTDDEYQIYLQQQKEAMEESYEYCN